MRLLALWYHDHLVLSLITFLINKVQVPLVAWLIVCLISVHAIGACCGIWVRTESLAGMVPRLILRWRITSMGVRGYGAGEH